MEAPRPVPVYLQATAPGRQRGSFVGTVGRYVLLVVFVVSVLLNFYLIMILRAGIEESEYRPGWNNQKIALIDLSGMIDMDSPGSLRRMLRKANEDETVKGVILVINSPGGQVAPSAMMHRYLEDFQNPPLRLEEESQEGEEKSRGRGKPVYAAIEQLGASGAYWAATAAEKIFAQENAMVGSIGVIYMNAVLRDLLESKLGVTPVVIKSSRSPHKDRGSFLRLPTAEEEVEIRADLDTIHKRFVSVVQEGRNLTEEQAWAVANGEVYDGPESLELGLVDGVGYLDDAIDAMASDLGLERPTVVRYAQPPTVLEAIGVRWPGGAVVVDIEAQLEKLATMPRIQALYLGQ